MTRIATRMRDNERREERLRKRFELPPFLKHFATNLNLLARQDKIAPVYGRDLEIQQVLEIFRIASSVSSRSVSIRSSLGPKP